MDGERFDAIVRCPTAAPAARSGGSGCSNVLSSIASGASTKSHISVGKGIPATSTSSCCTMVVPPPE